MGSKGLSKHYPREDQTGKEFRRMNFSILAVAYNKFAGDGSSIRDPS